MDPLLDTQRTLLTAVPGQQVRECWLAGWGSEQLDRSNDVVVLWYVSLYEDLGAGDPALNRADRCGSSRGNWFQPSSSRRSIRGREATPRGAVHLPTELARRSLNSGLNIG
jgi:hypothetical protein